MKWDDDDFEPVPMSPPEDPDAPDPGAMMRAVWDNPHERTLVLACADVLHARFGWPYTECVSHVEYHANRSIKHKAEWDRICANIDAIAGYADELARGE